MTFSRIAGLGSYLPGAPVSNTDLVGRGVDTTKYPITCPAQRIFFAKALYVWCNRANFPHRRLAR